MCKVVVIIQSSYIPWRGYFDLINRADECIVYDDVQFTKRDWRSRNMIKTPNGAQWLTIPVKTKGKYFQKINEVEVGDNDWCQKHWNAICHNYAKAPFFNQYKDIFKTIYDQLKDFSLLSKINMSFLQQICKLLNINTQFTFSEDYGFEHLTRTDRLVALCEAAKATKYISGPSAKAYVNPEQFQSANIELEYMNYADYSNYPQCFGDFIGAVSILDTMFNIGCDTKTYMKSSQIPSN